MARNSSRGRSSSRSASRGSGRGRGGSRDQSRGRSQSRGGGDNKGGDADFIMVGNVSVTKKSNENEEEILENMAAAIEDGLPLQEVLQQSGLKVSLDFWWKGDDDVMEIRRKDKVVITFKEPHPKAPDFNVATASLMDNN